MTAMRSQLWRFGIVGIAATLTHILVAIGFVELAGLPVLMANFLAFAAALCVSYGGNHRWTFERSGAHRRHLPRFVAVATGGLALNQFILWALAIRGGADYRLALGVAVLVVPALSFAVSRAWAFTPALGRPRDTAS